jgi:prepilin-type processing-associated H-X9-DG protein
MTEKVAKMKIRNPISIVIALALVFALAPSCRKEVQEPSPVGPSTFAEVLRLYASPNVISTGTTRNTTTISARFEKLGVGVGGATIYFEIDDSTGKKANVGFFDGNQAITSRVTDDGGSTSLTYFGPLSSELADNTTVYITAKTALTGNNFVSEITPIEIVADVTKVIFTANAYPNVLFATDQRPQSVIKAIALSGATPLANRKVFFEILNNLPGRFSDNTRNTFVLTNSAGEADITYLGPTDKELGGDTGIFIRARLETNSVESPGQTLDVTVYINVIKQH